MVEPWRFNQKILLVKVINVGGDITNIIRFEPKTLSVQIGINNEVVDVVVGESGRFFSAICFAECSFHRDNRLFSIDQSFVRSIVFDWFWEEVFGILFDILASVLHTCIYGIIIGRLMREEVKKKKKNTWFLSNIYKLT